MTDSRLTMCLMTWYSSDIPFAPSISRATRAISIAFAAEFLFIKEIISGEALLTIVLHQIIIKWIICQVFFKIPTCLDPSIVQLEDKLVN